MMLLNMVWIVKVKNEVWFADMRLQVTAEFSDCLRKKERYVYSLSILNVTNLVNLLMLNTVLIEEQEMFFAFSVTGSFSI